MLHLFDQKYNKTSNIIKYYYNFYFNIYIFFLLIYSASLLQSSEIILICWFAAQKIFLIINVESSCAA